MLWNGKQTRKNLKAKYFSQSIYQRLLYQNRKTKISRCFHASDTDYGGYLSGLRFVEPDAVRDEVRPGDDVGVDPGPPQYLRRLAVRAGALANL